MVAMNIFDSDAFSMVSLTQAIEKIPYTPDFLGSLGIFESVPVRTVTVAIEKREQELAIIQTSERGAPLEEQTVPKRDIRDFRTVRIAKGDTVQAAEIQNIRAFGSESEMQTVQAEMAYRYGLLLRDMELTHENMRLGAIQGIVRDADGSVLRNWYTEWGIQQPAEIDFDLEDDTTNVRKKCADVVRAMMRAGKGAWTASTRVIGLAGDEFYDALINHPSVRDTYLNWTAAAELRGLNVFGRFDFGGISFYNYRGTDSFSDGATGGVNAVGIKSEECKFLPVGAPGVFKVAYSPAESFEFVNTPGRPRYAMLIRDQLRNMWVRPEVYSYPLYICTRPEMLQRANMQIS